MQLEDRQLISHNTYGYVGIKEKESTYHLISTCLMSP